MNQNYLVMDIEATKLELMQLLLQTQEEDVLIRLHRVFQEQSSDWWKDLSPEERNEIQVGIRQADEGKYIENNEVRKKFERWH